MSKKTEGLAQLLSNHFEPTAPVVKRETEAENVILVWRIV